MSSSANIDSTKFVISVRAGGKPVAGRITTFVLILFWLAMLYIYIICIYTYISIDGYIPKKEAIAPRFARLKKGAIAPRFARFIIDPKRHAQPASNLSFRVGHTVGLSFACKQKRDYQRRQ